MKMVISLSLPYLYHIFLGFAAESLIANDAEFLEPVEAEHSVYVGTAAIIMVAVEAACIVLLDSDHWVTLCRKRTYIKRRGLKRKKLVREVPTKKSKKIRDLAKKYLAVRRLVRRSTISNHGITVILE